MAPKNPGANPGGENQIGSGFTEGELQFASFWVRNRIMLRNAVWGLVLTLNVVLWGYALWGLFDAYILSWPRESRITSDIANNAFLAQQLQENQPQGVQTRGVQVFQGTESRLDMIVEILNPNERWWPTFTYRFNVTGELTPQRSGFVLPGERTYLGEFGFLPESVGGKSAVLTVDNIQWHRIDPRQVGEDYKAWISARNAFQYDKVSFSRELQIGTKRVSRTSFDFVNGTAYGYWDMGLYVVLKRGESAIAATFVSLDRVKPGERRPVHIDWFETLPEISETEIVPVVNFLDDAAYLPSTLFE